MKRNLLTIGTAITAIAASISLYLTALPNPTEAQKNLSNTTNSIVIAGATAIFGMLDDQNKDDQESDNEDSN